MATYIVGSSLARFSGLFVNQSRVALSRYTQYGVSVQQGCRFSAMTKPGEPKQPMKSFMIFFQEKRPEILEKNPGIKTTEASSKAGEMWRALTKKELESYKTLYVKAKEQYDKDHAAWKATYTEEEWNKLLVERTADRLDKKKKREKRKLKKEWREEGKPRKPGYAMSYFMKGKKGKIMEHLDAWKALTDKEKQVYVEMYKVDLVTYQAALKEWQQKMVKKGLLHLLPKKMQPQITDKKKKKKPIKTTEDKKSTEKSDDEDDSDFDDHDISDDEHEKVEE